MSAPVPIAKAADAASSADAANYTDPDAPPPPPPPPPQRKRAHKACLNCRRRKAKCELDPDAAAPNTPAGTGSIVCKRCKEEGAVCEIPTIERRGGFTNVLAGKERRRLQELLKSRSSQSVSSLDWTASSAPSAPSSWAAAAAAGMRPKATRSASMSLHDHELALRDEPLLPDSAAGGSGSASGSASGSVSGSTHDAVTPPRDAASLPRSLTAALFEQRAGLAPQRDKGFHSFPEEVHAHLEQAQIVQDGIIDAEDIPELVSFFFSHMDPFFYPFLPRTYHDIRRLVREPAMLVVICTIAAKARLKETYNEQHRRLWAYCKQVVSSLMWECPDDEVQSLIYAVLLLCEWLPGAMYLGADRHTSGIDAIKRYTRICWPLLGQAVRLARYAGLLDCDVQAFITLHLSDHLLACRLGCQPMVGQLFEVDTPMPIAASIADRARLDIVKIMHLSNRMLYGSATRPTRELISSGQYLSQFHMLLAQLDEWRANYPQYPKCETFRDRVMMCEFHHIPLHTFSLAIIPWQERQQRQHLERAGRAHNSGANSPDYENLIGLEESRKFVDLASDAARFMVEHIEDPSNPVNLRYAPIQWIMRLLYSGVFLAKTLLIGALHPTKERQKNTIRIIRKAVEVMRSSQPGRYDPYCDLLDAICDQVISGGVVTSHIVALERLQNEYKASKIPGTGAPHAAHHAPVESPPLTTRSADAQDIGEGIPILHEVPSNQPFKSRRLFGFSPPLSPGKSQWLETGPVEPEPEFESDLEQEKRKGPYSDVASLECNFNTMEDMESIWDFLSETNFTDLSASPPGRNAAVL